MSKLIIDGREISIDDQLRDLDRSDCEDDLYTFLKNAWKYIDSSDFTDGWPIQAVADHLQSVADGDIKRLIINIPPRCAKSSLTSVAFPAWVWAQPWSGHTSGPGIQFLHASYAQQLSLRDSVKCRRLIESPWYQSMWGDRFSLTSDQNTKTRFDNNKGGSRLSTSVGSALTGEGGNIIVVDDPNAAQEAFSEASIYNTIEWWDSALSTRLNDPKHGSFVVIQQRLSEEDLTGHILSKDMGEWTHLCLPMRYEWRRHSYSSLGWHDPRGLDEDGEPLIEVSEDGERIPINIDAEIELDKREGTLLWPERFGEREVAILERQLGPWASAGQLQQRPEPKGGGIIKSDWWQPWDATNYPNMDMIIACVDTAYTKKTENDPSAMTVWGIFSQDVSVQAPNHAGGRHGGLISYERPYTETNPRVMLMYAWQGRYELHDLVNKVSETCKKMKVDTLLIENKAAGHSVAQEIKRMYGFERFSVQMFDPKSQDKLARLYSIQHLFAEGLVYAPNKAWAEMVIQQVGQFPKGKHDDLCLVGNTRILMADGTEKLLQEVVVGDIVRTPKGTQRVSASSLTGIKPIWRLDYSGGSIEGTAFHPVFANGEWKELAFLCPSDTLTSYQSDEVTSWLSKAKTKLLWKLSPSTVAGTTAIQIQATQRIVGTLLGQAHACIATYGSFITGKFQRVFKSTTLITTPVTMTSQTLSACHPSSIGVNTTWTTWLGGSPSSSLPIWQKFKSLQRIGTVVKKGVNGIVKTPTHHFGLPERLNHTAKAITRGFVSGAVRALKLGALKSLCAQRPVSKENPDTCVVEAVKFTHTMQPVYNMTVEGEGCYYANGILVHNCDTVSMAMRHLRDTGVILRPTEWQAELEDSLQFKGVNKNAPLYPA
jgi:predicted phage terminase large subunit-like protein